MEFDFKIPQANLDKVRSAYTDLVAAEARLKKARRRARIVRTTEKIILIAGVSAIYNRRKNRK